MKKILLIAICLVSVQANSADIPSLANEIAELTAPACSSDKAVEANANVYIGFLRGSPVDAANDPQAGEDYLNLSKEILTKKGYNVVITSAHHTSWDTICRQFKTAAKKNANSKIVLVGHSYGSSGALKVANCLWEEGQIKTDLLITVSSFDFLAGIDVTKIPANVVSHYNFSVDNPLIPGYKTHTAMNTESTHIQNVEAKVGMTHIGAAGKLLQTLALVTTAEVTGKVGALKLADKIDSSDMNKNLAGSWSCQQPERAQASVKVPDVSVAQAPASTEAPASVPNADGEEN